MRTSPVFLVLLLSLAPFGSVHADPSASAELAWPQLTRESKPWTRWWWLGSAVDKPNLTRELEAIAAAGFGGVEITPIYGAKGFENRFIPFLSPKYLEMVAHVGSEARRLGLGVDMATGTGWPFGGRTVSADDAELKLAFAADGRIAAIPTKFKVKRSAPGGEGLVLNPYSTAALQHYLAPFTEALASLPAGTINGQFHDSFEYQANWAREVPNKFRTLHGYSIRERAAELSGEGDPEIVARIKADYRTTLAALHLDYVRTWVDWAHSLGQTARNQAHGAPGNLLDLYGASDIPETEIFGSLPFPIPGFRRDPAEIGNPGHPPIIHRFASSAAHVMGKPLVSSETFTWLREHFHESPSEMKPELDALFLAGINHVYYHGNAYSPADAPWPGWLFYASSQLNPRNPLWRDLGDGLNPYTARCQSLLQAGEPDNDLLVYWPADDLWHNADGRQIQLSVHGTWLETSPTGKLMEQLAANGFSYDLISDAQLQQIRIVDQQIKTPGGTYRGILVPKTERMEPRTLQRLLAIAKTGTRVLFLDSLPTDVPGYGRLGERRKQFQRLITQLKQLPTTTDGKKIEPTTQLTPPANGPLADLLESYGFKREPLVKQGLQFIRRKMAGGYLYFIVNQSAQAFDGWVTPANHPTSAALMNPQNGQVGLARVNSQKAVYLQLASGESIFLKIFTDQTVPGPPHRYIQTTKKPVVLDGDWKITALVGGPTLPPTFSQYGFRSWTEQGGEWEQFGGTARYEIQFTLPADTDEDDWLLDLGDVRETARVFVNGQEIDLLWSLPMRTQVGSFLKPGKNTLAIEVTNLAANRIRDLDQRKVEWKKFHEINFVNIAYKPFDASLWPLQPSGLLGKVKLVPLKNFRP